MVSVYAFNLWFLFSSVQYQRTCDSTCTSSEATNTWLEIGGDYKPDKLWGQFLSANLSDRKEVAEEWTGLTGTSSSMCPIWPGQWTYVFAHVTHELGASVGPSEGSYNPLRKIGVRNQKNVADTVWCSRQIHRMLRIIPWERSCRQVCRWHSLNYPIVYSWWALFLITAYPSRLFPSKSCDICDIIRFTLKFLMSSSV